MPIQEIVSIELTSADKMRLASELANGMEKIDVFPDCSKLDIGIELTPNWPIDCEHPPTLAEFSVLAKKLKMKLIINGIDLFPDGT